MKHTQKLIELLEKKFEIENEILQELRELDPKEYKSFRGYAEDGLETFEAFHCDECDKVHPISCQSEAKAVCEDCYRKLLRADWEYQAAKRDGEKYWRAR